MSKFPDRIYQTHENWGETQYADWDTMYDIIESLKELGEDWEDVSISDCEVHKLIKPIEEGRAVYTGGWITDGYNRNGRSEIVIFETDEKNDGYFIRYDSFDPRRDADIIEELGIE